LVPLSDPGAATSSGNTIPSQTITLADLTNNFEEYESELVTINSLEFADAGGTFENGTVYPVSDPSGSYNFRSSFFFVDYIDGTIPGISNVTGIPNSRLDGPYFTARDLADFEEVSAIKDLSVTNFQLAPNPSNGSFRLENLGVAGDYELQIIDLLGKRVFAQQFYFNDRETKNINLDIKQSGLYLVQLRHLEQNFVHSTKVVFE